MNKSAAKRMKQRSAGKPDIELGKRIRLRRVEQKISQAELGDKLGVSFQQVQKYEKGVNRVCAARLQQIATVLDVRVTFFYDGHGKELVRSQQHQLPLISRLFWFEVENLERHGLVARRSLERRDIDRSIEPQKRELRPHRVVERTAVFAP